MNTILAKGGKNLSHREKVITLAQIDGQIIQENYDRNKPTEFVNLNGRPSHGIAVGSKMGWDFIQPGRAEPIGEGGGK